MPNSYTRPVSDSDIPNLDASKITTGKLALARGGTNADLSASGGTSQVLKQSTVGGNITVETLTSTEAMAGFTGTKDSTTLMRGDGTTANGVSGPFASTLFRAFSTVSMAQFSANTNDGTDNQGSVMTGGGNYASPGSVQTRGAVRFAHGNEHALGGVIADCVGEAGYQSFYNAAGVESVRFTGGEIRLPAGNTVAGVSTGRWLGSSSGSALIWQINFPTSGGVRWSANGSNIGQLDGAGVAANNVIGFSANMTMRPSTSDGIDNQSVAISGGGGTPIAPGLVQTRGATLWLPGNEHTQTGNIDLCPGEAGVTRIRNAGGNIVAALDSVGTQMWGGGVIIPTGGAWTTIRSLSAGQSKYTVIVDAFGTIEVEWDGTTLTEYYKPSGSNLAVTPSPSGTQIGLRASGGNLQGSNATGTSRAGSSPLRIAR